MSRSFKKNPICGWSTAKSEKKDKVRAHKKFRKLTKNKLKEIEKIKDLSNDSALVSDDSIPIPEELLPEKIEEVSNVATFAKDGKQRVTGKEKKKILRK